MGLLSNLKARLGRIGIDPNISIPPKLTPSLPRGPVVRLPKRPPSIGRLPSIEEPMPSLEIPRLSPKVTGPVPLPSIPSLPSEDLNLVRPYHGS